MTKIVNAKDGTWVAIITFDVNSGAYVAETIRSGIMAIDVGQMEAGRSLGFSKIQTMWLIILPQAFKNILPAIGNEMIALLKETSVAGYIAIQDLTKVSDLVRARTYQAFFALIFTAIIYFVMSGILTRIVEMVEKKIDPKRRPQDKILEGIQEIE